MMIDIVLCEPEIPQNTGNIIRLCANSGANLHLIQPFGFDMEDKKLRRAGLDYHEFANIIYYKNFEDFIEKNKNRRIFACTTKSKKYYYQIDFKKDDMFIFGAETRGLSKKILEYLSDTQVKIPMVRNSRSLNLSNSVAILLYAGIYNIGFDNFDYV